MSDQKDTGEWTCERCQELSGRVWECDLGSDDWQPRMDTAMQHVLEHLGRQARPVEPAECQELLCALPFGHKGAHSASEPAPQVVTLEMRSCNGPHGAPTRNDPNCEWCKRIDPRPIHEQYADDGVQSPEEESLALGILEEMIVEGVEHSWANSVMENLYRLKDDILAREKAHQEQVEQLTHARDFHFDAANRLQEQVEQLQRERENLLTNWNQAMENAERFRNERDAARRAAREIVEERGNDDISDSFQALATKRLNLIARLKRIAKEACDKAEKEGL